jgi:hypothetical protein
MDERSNCLIANALKALDIADISQITGRSQALLIELLTQYVPIGTLLRMLAYHSMYQLLLYKINTSTTKLVYMQYAYWQELCFIWQTFMSDKSNDHNACYGRADFVKKFYLCQIRSLQELLVLYPELDSKTYQYIKLNIKRLHNIVSNAL